MPRHNKGYPDVQVNHAQMGDEPTKPWGNRFGEAVLRAWCGRPLAKPKFGSIRLGDPKKPFFRDGGLSCVRCIKALADHGGDEPGAEQSREWIKKHPEHW